MIKLVHKFILPATIIVALSVGSAVCSANEVKALKDKGIINVPKVVKTAVLVEDDHKKEKLNSAKKKARRNLQLSLAEKVKNGELSTESAEKALLAFDENIKSDVVHSFTPISGAENPNDFDFSREFKDELYNQAERGGISFERAEDIYTSFVDMTV